MPKAYKPEDKTKQANQVFDLMREGLSSNQACRKIGLPPSTLSRWVDEDEKLAEQYARAREELIEKIAAEIIEIADQPVGTNDKGSTDAGAVQKQRLQVDTRKWLLSKLAPKKYGDRLELAGDKENPLQVQTIDPSKLSTDVLAQIMAAKDASNPS